MYFVIRDTIISNQNPEFPVPPYEIYANVRKYIKIMRGVNPSSSSVDNGFKSDHLYSSM